MGHFYWFFSLNPLTLKNQVYFRLMGEKIGYARVSTREQNLSSQEDALNNAGCVRIFTDKISGKEFRREGLTACMDYLRSGDTLVIYRLA